MSFNKQAIQSDRPISEVIDIDQKRWIVRGLLLTAIGMILGLKLYAVLFTIIDFLAGFYLIATTAILLSYLLSGWLKYKDPFVESEFGFLPNYKPLVSIIVPVKNEESNIIRCVKSCVNSSYSNKEVIIVDDGSTDKTPQILDDLKKSFDIKVIHLSKNIGKKQAVEKAVGIAKGSIFVSMDSDTIMDSEAVSRTVKIFSNDPKLGALVGHGRVIGAESGNTLQKIQDVWFDSHFRIIKGAESSYSSVTCCSGSYSAFRSKAIKPIIHLWAHDKFLGREFVFATDRLLTGFILGYSPKENSKPELDSTPTHCLNPDAFVIKKENFELKDGDKLKNSYRWNIKYSSSINVQIGVPITFSSFIKQQIRWKKSFIRSVFATGSIYWKRPFPMSLIYYLTIFLRVVRPYIMIHSLLFLPLTGDFTTPIFYLVSVFFVGMVYGVDYRLRNRGSSLWLYRPLMTLLNTFVLSWLLFVALIKIRDKTWR